MLDSTHAPDADLRASDDPAKKPHSPANLIATLEHRRRHNAPLAYPDPAPHVTHEILNPPMKETHILARTIVEGWRTAMMQCGNR